MNYLIQNQTSNPNESIKRMLIDSAKKCEFEFTAPDTDNGPIYQWKYVVKPLKMQNFGNKINAKNNLHIKIKEELVYRIEQEIDTIALLTGISAGQEIYVHTSIGIWIKRPNNSLGIKDLCNFMILNTKGIDRYYINKLEYDKNQFYEYLGNNEQLSSLKTGFISIEEKKQLNQEIVVTGMPSKKENKI